MDIKINIYIYRDTEIALISVLTDRAITVQEIEIFLYIYSSKRG